MDTTGPCDQCWAILHEFRSAYAEFVRTPELRAELQSATDSFFKVLQRTVEDDAFDDESLGKLKFYPQLPGSPIKRDDEPRFRLREAIRKLGEHCVRSGHKPWLRP